MNSVSLSLHSRHSAALARAVKGLTPDKITDAIQRRHDLEIDLESLDNSLAFFKEEYDGDKKEHYIQIVLDKMEAVEGEVYELSQIRSLAERRREDEEALADDLEWLLLDTVKYFDVPKSAILEYARGLAEDIMMDYPHFTIEDVAVCFQKAKDGVYGEIYNRLDGQIVKRWLREYSDNRTEVVERKNASRHMALKAGNNEGRIKAEDPRKLMEEAKVKLMIDHARKESGSRQ